MSVLLVMLAFAQGSLPMTTLTKSDLSGVDHASQVVVQTAAEWSALWKAHAPERPMPAVDFSTNMLIAVFLGSRPTSGYSIEIRRITAGPDAVEVEYVEQQPDPQTITAQILTAPCHIVTIPRRPAVVKFVRLEGSPRD